jgi:uncharacterized protein (DUF488 family)
MVYRRKILLALLQAFEGSLPKISLQKLLFLFTIRQAKPGYDFVPYHYGCYSFSASADLAAMVRHGLLSEDETSFTKYGRTNYVATLEVADKDVLRDVKSKFGKFSANSLMKFTYINHRYFAINSIKARRLLTDEEYENVLQAKPKIAGTILYTIGYEGISLEEYLNRLIKHDVKVLVDVRSNPLSMKFGFSKTQLKTFCASLGIEYVNIPQVGIQSEHRQALNSQADYNSLFEIYKETTLKQTLRHQEEILQLLEQKQRIALTCFEANICQCHRKPLAEAITKLHSLKFELKHI